MYKNDIDNSDKILFFEPRIMERPWGGTGLKEKWGYETGGIRAGECWGISAHPNGDLKIKEGSYRGETLSGLWKKAPELFGNRNEDGTLRKDRFPLLVKIIDAGEDLSIQVHPDDAYAKKYENGSLGKTECWYVLEAPEGASVVIGHNASDKEELADMIRNGRWKEFIREVPVEKGDLIRIDPGTVHAIKGGIEVLETQENSDITYRVYDYDRVVDGKKRELMIDRSLDVIRVPAEDIALSLKKASDYEGREPDNGMIELMNCDYFILWKIRVEDSLTIRQEYGFMAMTVIEGKGLAEGREIQKGDHFLLLCGIGEVRFSGNMIIIASAPSC
ncbi:MAG: class I mannose-6-phosphate isomerase [Lachnospiraceae bacterium]|nr:class I mannose-6-phosphate isomerase [Lachnospiraceae bacterium]